MPGQQRRWPVVDDKVRRRIRARIAEGMSCPEIAAGMGFPVGTIVRVVNEMGGKEAVAREENGPVPVRNRPRTHYCFEHLHWARRARKRRERAEAGETR